MALLDKSTPRSKSSTERRREQNRQAQRNRRRNMKVRMDHYDQLCDAMGIEPVCPDRASPSMLSPPLSTRSDGQDQSITVAQQTGENVFLDDPSFDPALPSPEDIMGPVRVHDLSNDANLLGLTDDDFNFDAALSHEPSKDFALCTSTPALYVKPTVSPATTLQQSDRQNKTDNHLIVNLGASTALHYAVKTRSREIVTLLLKHGARVDVLDNAGETPLHLAVATEDCELLEDMLHILRMNASDDLCHDWVDLENGNGLTPLHLALCRNQEVAARLLLDAGADPNIPMPVDYP